MPRRFLLCFTFCFFSLLSLHAQSDSTAPDLSIGSSDMWISQGADGGYHLYIRKKPDINSVLLAETTRDPLFLEPNYAYRAAEWNPYNGNEMRIIDGNPLPQSSGGWFLVDSTPEYVQELGTEVFHVYIPYIVYYGYPETRHGEVYVGNDTYINIRTFTLPYADYRGKFKDNPFLLQITQQPLAGPPEGNYMKDTQDAFMRITRATNGKLHYSTGPNDIVGVVRNVIASEAQTPGQNLDLVFCIDTTASMRNDIEALRKYLINETKDITAMYARWRIGMVLYRDYGDAYLTRIIPFTEDYVSFQNSLNTIAASGGRDIPEAVNEALYGAVKEFPWNTDALTQRSIILIGDAPPHPIPKGDITEEMAVGAARENGIKINAIVLPQ